MNIIDYLFEFVPKEIIVNILLFEPIKTIAYLCQTNKRFYNLIHNNEFWQRKFLNDFGLPPLDANIISWKDAYQNYGVVIIYKDENDGSYSSNMKYKSSIIKITEIRAKSVSCGGSHTVILDLNNNVWAYGDNSHGQLGLGDTLYIHTPIQIPRIKAKFVSCGGGYTMIIDLNDNVWSFGDNNDGQLGLGITKTIKLNNITYDSESSNSDEESSNDIYIDIPTQIPEIQAKFISCGDYHTMMIDLNDNVWACGWNEHGQLGLGDAQDRDTFIQIPGIKAKTISCGKEYTMIIDLNNNVWGFGDNGICQLGLGDRINRNIPTKIPEIRAKSISCGEYHTMMIDMNDNLWGFGCNREGQLGLGDRDYRLIPTQLENSFWASGKAKYVSCDGDSTIILGLDNIFWAAGRNNAGQLGSIYRRAEYLELVFNIKERGFSCGNIKGQGVSCGFDHIAIILHANQNFHDNVKLIPFNEATRKLNAGDFIRFDFLPGYQTIPHHSENLIATFDGRDGNDYLVELQYNQTTNQISPPV